MELFFNPLENKEIYKLIGLNVGLIVKPQVNLQLVRFCHSFGLHS
jgi:hypothetical protein